MDASDRLKMLFSGEDEVLLRTEAVNLRPAPQVAIPDPPVQQHSLPSGPSQSSYRPLADGDPELDDPYIAALVQSHDMRENARRRGGRNNRYGRRGRGGRHAAELITGKPSEMPIPFANGNQTGAHSFCQLSLLSRFPYKYIRGSDKDLVAKRFFDQTKFWNRTWDLYYIHPPSDISLQPLILVPLPQAQALLKEINDAFRSNYRFPSRPDQGFCISFENDGTPQPQHLGTSTNRDMKDALERSVPVRGEDFVPPPGSPAARSFEAFKAKIEAAVEASRRKNKAAKGKRQRDQGLRLQDWCRSLKRLHCYLGLRPRLARDNDKQLDIPKDASWETEKQIREEESLSREVNLLPLDVNQPAPFPFVDEPIFICIDVESNERCHTQITEIGISTLDTLDLAGVSPGPEGQNWIKKIRSRHFRISEYGHVINHDFVNGCPDRFEFGESQWISIKQAASMVDSCFYPPYSALTEFDGRKTYDDGKESESDLDDGGVKISFGEPETDESTPVEVVKDYKKRPRNLILLGHDIGSDMSYMTKLGCKVLSNEKSNAQSPFDYKPTFLESLDTSILFRVLKRETQASGLSKVLLDLGITGWNLHNAGNDARYTMEAMIAIALRARMQDHKADEERASTSTNDWPISPAMAKLSLGGDATNGKEGEQSRDVSPSQRAWETEVDRRVKAKVEEAEARVREECAMWEAAMGGRADWDTPLDDLDGGVATGLVHGRD